jgi:hypothetical protein
VEYLPAWAPGGKFKKIAAVMIKDRERLLNEPYDFAVNEIVRDMFELTPEPLMLFRRQPVVLGLHLLPHIPPEKT